MATCQFDDSDKKWDCGDCGRVFSTDVLFCPYALDNHLGIRSGTIETAIARAVSRAVDPLVDDAMRRLSRRPAKAYPREWGEAVFVPVTFALAA